MIILSVMNDLKFIYSHDHILNIFIVLEITKKKSEDDV